MSKRKGPIYQQHHVDRERYPDYTIPLRRWVHLFVRRQEQYNSTPDNLVEMEYLLEAITYIRDKMVREIKKPSEEGS